MNVFRFFMITILYFGLQACNSPTSIQETVSAGSGTTASTIRFADGVKGVKINTSIAVGTGSFGAPSTIPVATPIPSPFPGYDGVSGYTPGVAAAQYFDLDGTTVIAKPSWLQDVQLGVTSTSSVGACAAFGGSGTLDAENFYRVSERDCSTTALGTGGGADPVFARIVLNRKTSFIGANENLMIQVEYQSSGLHLNSDGASTTNPEDNLDQLWKVFWNTSVGALAGKPFSIFVPPNYGACLDSGSGYGAAPGNCSAVDYKGSPIKVKQIIVPLSAYPSMGVIQLTRVKGRVNQGAGGVTYVNSFCTTSDSPLCLGVVIRSITLMRM